MLKKNAFPIFLFLMLSFALGACAPASMLEVSAPESGGLIDFSAPTAAPTITPAPETAPTNAARPTENPTIQPVARDEWINPALNEAQREQLAEAAAAYISGTPEEAVDTARELAYATGPDPSLMCGPLALVILQDAELISQYIELKEFFLLNPRPEINGPLVEEVFPRYRYEWIRNTTPLNEWDFTQQPLYAGDFVYTFGGNYEHMFVVTRVDEAGRAYAVNNLERGYLTGDPNDAAFLIQETLLYDPNQPGEGVFYEWTNPAYSQVLGLTGTEGLQIWRPSQPVPMVDEPKRELASLFDAIIGRGGDWKIRVETLDGETLYERRSRMKINPASSIKVLTAMQTMALLEQESGSDPLDARLQQRPPYTTLENDRSYAQLLRAMLVLSEEVSAEVLEDNLARSPARPDRVLNEWGFTQTSLTPRRSTPEELNQLLRGLYQSTWLSSESTALLLHWMSEYTENDDLRLGMISSMLDEPVTVYNKRASIFDPYLIVGDSGIIETANEVYLVQIFGFYDDERPVEYEQLEAMIGEMAQAFGAWIREYGGE